MRVLVTGTPRVRDHEPVLELLEGSPFDPSVVVAGEECTVDELAAVWAIENDAAVESHPMPRWCEAELGETAHEAWNRFVVSAVDACIIIWDGEGFAHRDLSAKAEAKGIPLYKALVRLDDEGQITTVRHTNLHEGDQTRLDRW